MRNQYTDEDGKQGLSLEVNSEKFSFAGERKGTKEWPAIRGRSGGYLLCILKIVQPPIDSLLP